MSNEANTNTSKNRGTQAPPKKEKVRIDNTELVTTFRAEGGGIYHRRPKGKERGFTVAYKLKGRRVTFATSVQHSADTFTKKIGTLKAIEAFHAGRVVTLPLRVKSTSTTLHAMFSWW